LYRIIFMFSDIFKPYTVVDHERKFGLKLEPNYNISGDFGISQTYIFIINGRIISFLTFHSNHLDFAINVFPRTSYTLLHDIHFLLWSWMQNSNYHFMSNHRPHYAKWKCHLCSAIYLISLA